MGTGHRKSLRQKQKMKKRRILVFSMTFLICAVVLTVIAISINKINNNVFSSAEANENKENGDSKQDTLKDEDNSKKDEDKEESKDRYLSLEEDPNAEDAMMVFNNTHSLLKGEKTYPVRTDGKKVVYLTFDDGPSTENTESILDVLDENNVKATFFILGSALDSKEECKEILKRIAYSGQAIGNHTYSHDYKYLYPGKVINPDNFMNDVEKCNVAMRKVLGEDFKTRAVRFPGGYWSWKGRENVRPLLDEKGYGIFDWNALNGDAEGAKKDATQLVEKLKQTVEQLGPNADSIVVLMHDTYGKGETVKALPDIIQYFRDKGFEFKTIK